MAPPQSAHRLLTTALSIGLMSLIAVFEPPYNPWGAPFACFLLIVPGEFPQQGPTQLSRAPVTSITRQHQTLHQVGLTLPVFLLQVAWRFLTSRMPSLCPRWVPAHASIVIWIRARLDNLDVTG